ncbi:MAG: DUF4139 domain-containing protein [Rhodobacteraceae bacterium]|nr:DUF4139 domain-containing protein [Paracoccaceae bacterium]
MRALACCLVLIPTALWADDIPLASAVTAATLYPRGATLTRTVPFQMPAGQHRLILTDLPRYTPLAGVRVAVTGATMGSVTTRADFVPPRDAAKTAALAAAEARVTAAEDALRTAEARVRAIRAEGDAARARIAFLARLGAPDPAAQMDVAALRDLAAMIGDETLAATRAALDADERAGTAERALKDLHEALDQARQALAALVPEAQERALLAVAVSADAPAQGTLSVTYTVDEAGWRPVYDLRLDRGAGMLAIARGAFVAQDTGENWQDVALTLSTLRPSEQTAPSTVDPLLHRIEDPAEMLPKSVRSRMAEGVMGGMMADAPEPAPMAEMATASFDGLSVSYVYPGAVDIASGADRVRLALGALSTNATITAQAAPLWDDTAFLMADLTNDTGELILPTDEAMFYLDGRFVGKRTLDLIPAGGAAALSFGPIEGLRLTRTVLDRNEGDRGVIRKSNDWTEEVRITVENLTDAAWPIRLIDRVPYSEQEDLAITWTARPEPTATDIDGLRGVLEWRFDLAAGDSRDIALSHRMSWPEGKVLR